jgi:hypothetical protein
MNGDHGVRATAMHQAAPFPAQQQRQDKNEGAESGRAGEQGGGGERHHDEA